MFNKITIIGAGYVGFSLAVLLSQKKTVVVHDIDENKLEKINNKISPLSDNDIQNYLDNKNLDIKTSNNLIDSLNGSELIIIALPTNFDTKTNSFNTKIISNVITDIDSVTDNKIVVIKSTVPIGFTNKVSKENVNNTIIFSPEFLREGSSLHDNLYPQRIIIGDQGALGQSIGELFSSFALNEPKSILMSSDEAEATKLFSNSYLASRVSFFNELDTFAIENNLNSKSIIDGVTSDSRIGEGYSNPSFGYGGYCLPKDTKQLVSNFNRTPQNIFKAIVQSNITRKKYIASHVVSLNKNVIGIFRLIMKKGSDNFRESAVFDIIENIKELDDSITILVYEPLANVDNIKSLQIINSLEEFKNKSQLILANRLENDLLDVKDKVYTRDVYGES
ncbi:nucleotide sugar dehydrogenase [Gammaproteobacteria bacterium]|nr:nucleotide sugar dehydrogenase [Gammaproteobacteria bacterium]